jgi:hypothetical protein
MPDGIVLGHGAMASCRFIMVLLSCHQSLNSCFFWRVPKQTQGISEANATSSSTQLLQARTTQPPKHNPWVPVALRHTPHHSLLYHEAHKTWLKWRGPLPMMKRLRRRSVRGSAVFAHRYKHGGRLVTCFWVRQRVELHVVRWSKLGSVALPSQRMVTERAGARGDWIRT